MGYQIYSTQSFPGNHENTVISVCDLADSWKRNENSTRTVQQKNRTKSDAILTTPKQRLREICLIKTEILAAECCW